MSRVLETVWQCLVAILFVMVALRELGVTDGFDFPAATITVLAVASVAEYLRMILARTPGDHQRGA